MTTVAIDHPADGVGRITLDRPPVNALDLEAYQAIGDALVALAADADVRAIVLTGAGTRTFSAGTDLGQFGTAAVTTRVTQAALHAFGALATSPQPVVGALNGPAVGAGAMLASECDLLLASRATYFSVPEVTAGFPGGGSHIKRLAPWFVVHRMMLLGDRWSAEDAHAHGTVLSVHETREDLESAAVGVAVRLAALDPAAVRAARTVLRRESSQGALAGYREELLALSQVIEARRPTA